MKVEVVKREAFYNKSPYGNTKKLVMVAFSDFDMKNGVFYWLPSYKQLAEITKNLKEVERDSWNNKDKEVLENASSKQFGTEK